MRKDGSEEISLAGIIRDCIYCGETKTLNLFVKDKRCKEYGRCNKCLDCRKRLFKELRQDPAYRLKEKEYHYKWYRTNGKEIVKKNFRKHRELHGPYKELDPLKKKARTLTQTAIRNGTLVRKKCEKCGDPKSQAHHPDYSKPLYVEWLCSACHHAEHFSIRKAE